MNSIEVRDNWLYITKADSNSWVSRDHIQMVEYKHGTLHITLNKWTESIDIDFKTAEKIIEKIVKK